MEIVLENIIERIIAEKATLRFNYFIDIEGVFKTKIANIKVSLNLVLICIDDIANIVLKGKLASIGKDKNVVLYSNKKQNIDSYITTGSGKEFVIEIDEVLKKIEGISQKINDSITLKTAQKMLFLEHFNDLCNILAKEEKITQETIKKAIVSYLFLNNKFSIESLLVKLLKNNLDISILTEADLLKTIIERLKMGYDLSFSDSIFHIPDLFRKVLLTRLKNELKSDFPSIVSNEIIDINEDAVEKLFDIIQCNADAFTVEIESLNVFCEERIKEKEKLLSYTIPYLFKKYIVENLDNIDKIVVEEQRLWTNEMQEIFDFVSHIRKMSELCDEYIMYHFEETTMDFYIKKYKDSIWEIDNLYRRIVSQVERFSISTDNYLSKIKEKAILVELDKKYYNVIANINSQFITNYIDLLANKKDSIQQSQLLKNAELSSNTVIMICDGLRYEMAKELILKLNLKDIEEHSVYSELPSETEVCFNSFFIEETDKIVLNDKNIFELISNGKREYNIHNWRLSKLIKKYGSCISFDEFKSNTNYKGKVLYMNDFIDNAIHTYNEMYKVSDNLNEIGEIIKYINMRGFDILLLADHGFISVNKIEDDYKGINIDKKKNRYFITDKTENIDKSFLLSGYPVAEYLDTGNKQIGFINSINSIRECGSFAHGGISLQENIIPAIVIKSSKKELTNEKEYIINLQANNSISFELENLDESRENWIEIINNGRQILRQNVINQLISCPISRASIDNEYIVILFAEENEISRKAVKRESIRKIDKDLDIF